jgi:hypothetical protein
MNPNTLMKIYLLKNGDQLTFMQDYYIDYNTMELVVKNPIKEVTYRLVVYFNYNSVNEILNNSTYDNIFDVDKLKDSKFEIIEGTNIDHETQVPLSTDTTKVDKVYTQATEKTIDSNYHNIVNAIDITYGNNIYIILISNSNRIAYSNDGRIWVETTISNITRNWKSIYYANNKFIILSKENVFAYSIDGMLWEEITITSPIRDWNNIIYCNNKFYAIATDSNIFLYSIDGIIWTDIDIFNVTQKWWYHVIW